MYSVSFPEHVDTFIAAISRYLEFFNAKLERTDENPKTEERLSATEKVRRVKEEVEKAQECLARENNRGELTKQQAQPDGNKI
jgi:hypothetical protein